MQKIDTKPVTCNYMLTPMLPIWLLLKKNQELLDLYKNNNTPQPTLNAPVHIECQVLKHVVSSAAEAEKSAIFEHEISCMDKNNVVSFGSSSRNHSIKNR